MTFAQYVMLAAVVAAMLAGFRIERPYVRNITAAALVLQYVTIQGVWIATRAPVPTPALWLTDMVVLFAIWSKPPVSGAMTGSFGHLWRERTWWDRGVIICFAPAWHAYVFNGAAWWLLYFPALAQLLLSIGEAIANHRAHVAKARADDDPDFPSAGLQFAVQGSGDYG